MHAEFNFPEGILFSFLLVLARIAALFTFFPLPGSGSAPAVARIVFAIGFTMALRSAWPVLPDKLPPIGDMLVWLAAETALGAAAGCIVALLTDSFAFAAQVISLQAGYSYASTIDPNTQTDAGILPLLLQLVTGLMLFSTGLDQWILRALAHSLQAHPPGAFTLTPQSAKLMIDVGQHLLTLSLRLALPAVLFLWLVDLTLGMLTRLNAQVQLLSLAFPIKMLIALALLISLAALLPALYERASSITLKSLWTLIG